MQVKDVENGNSFELVSQVSGAHQGTKETEQLQGHFKLCKQIIISKGP